MFNNRTLIIGAGVVLAVLIWLGLSKRNDPNTIAVQQSSAQAEVYQDQKSPNNSTAQNLYAQANSFLEGNDKVKAKETFQNIITEYPDYENIELIQKKLEGLNLDIIFSNTPTSKSVMHEVKSGDTLGGLSKKYGTTIELIKISNRLNSDIIRIGQQLRIWTGTFNIFVDKSQNILILKDGDEVIKVYDVSTGENGSTPVGEFKVTTKLVDPVWFNRGVVVPPESPSNVLGSRWLGFDIPGYGIHGTIEPESIGQAVTAGCVRMRNEEVEELYSVIPLGTLVKVVD